MVIKQCMCGSYREKNNIPNFHVSATHFPYVGCLAFVNISLRNNKICAISGYINHSEQCKTSQLQHDSLYKLLLYIKKNVETLLNLNVSTADILAQNAKMANASKKLVYKIKNDPAKNLEQFLEPDTNPSELKKVCLHYQPYTKETGHLEIIIKNPNTTAITFSSLVAMIDTDVKEQKSLLRQLGRRGRNDIILQCQTLKMYLRNVLKEAWTIDGNENVVCRFIKEKKNSLETIIYKSEDFSNDTKKFWIVEQDSLLI
ncbi:8144_t:CDS:2 [Cetraspora pellucida]|uniref:8144_t:CDS:1 n=1 Tax=Cetraspora pellucida TaxID=1433469 RepID=A0A9N9JNR6_9GLOM|nr:8144_t:CDS:2 [Cetraspora pellucida]